MNIDKLIVAEIEIPAPRKDVWDAWTTEAGAQCFFAPRCRIDLRPGGAYEMYFNLDVPIGQQGSEGMIVMAIEPEEMLSFTWNSPPHLKTVRNQMTMVQVWFSEIDKSITRVTLRHTGWGISGEWDEAYNYFDYAWNKIVLPRLKYLFEVGPVDWKNPPGADV